MDKIKDDEIKQYELNLLKKIDQICFSCDITYYLAFGTLLGAIRHHGFIPWDDDVDVMMPRKDYEKFIKYCIENEEEMYPYKIIHYSNNKDYVMALARFCDTTTEVIENGTRGYGLGIFVDVYPLDGCGKCEKDMLKIFRKNRYRRFLVGVGASEQIERRQSTYAKWVVKRIIHKMANVIGINTILRKMDDASKKNAYEKSKYVACTTWAIYRKKARMFQWQGDDSCDIFERKWFGIPKRIIFENIEVNIPEYTHEILTRRYGDYMRLPSEDERIAHHNYTAYKR